MQRDGGRRRRAPSVSCAVDGWPDGCGPPYGVFCAVAAESLRVIEGVLAIRHRLRAVRDWWVPRLERALAEVTLAIEEQERSDVAR